MGDIKSNILYVGSSVSDITGLLKDYQLMLHEFVVSGINVQGLDHQERVILISRLMVLFLYKVSNKLSINLFLHGHKVVIFAF